MGEPFFTITVRVHDTSLSGLIEMNRASLTNSDVVDAVLGFLRKLRERAPRHSDLRRDYDAIFSDTGLIRVYFNDKPVVYDGMQFAIDGYTSNELVVSPLRRIHVRVGPYLWTSVTVDSFTTYRDFHKSLMEQITDWLLDPKQDTSDKKRFLKSTDGAYALRMRMNDGSTIRCSDRFGDNDRAILLLYMQRDMHILGLIVA